MLERMRGEVGAAGPITVEEHMEREALRQLFGKEF